MPSVVQVSKYGAYTCAGSGVPATAVGAASNTASASAAREARTMGRRIVHWLGESRRAVEAAPDGLRRADEAASLPVAGRCRLRGLGGAGGGALQRGAAL